MARGNFDCPKLFQKVEISMVQKKMGEIDIKNKKERGNNIRGAYLKSSLILGADIYYALRKLVFFFPKMGGKCNFDPP